MKVPVSSKHLQISKANSTIMTVVAIATIVTVFCLVSSKALLSQATYQNRLISAKNATVKQLETNKGAADQLVNHYKTVFDDSGPVNLIGGKNDKSALAAPPDVDNTKLVLNALPTTYDFPALISSLSKIMNSNNMGSPTISGTDESVSANNQPSATPQPVVIKISMSGQNSYGGVQRLIRDLERSIRPFDVTSLQLNGSQSFMNVGLNLNTYYQPAKTLTAGTKEVR
ncbi:MAG: hypothetical protein WD887_00230 [Candidatus Saccharimonadales bacterium]